MLELNISTILLQMANFFVLAFILYRFLLKPLQNMLQKRAEKINHTMDAAKETQVEAEELKRQYEEKNHNIDAEIAARKNEARIVIEQSRQQMLHEVQTQIDQLQTQTEDALERLQVKAVQQHKEQLGDLAAEFARGILSDVMTPELEATYQKEFLNKIKTLDLSPHAEGTPPGEVTFIKVITASQPSEFFQDHLSGFITQNLGSETQLSYEVDPHLIAGGILRFENELIDGSLQGQIGRFQKRYQGEA
jgi:F-type H+-transporting ATPase subunit b